MLAVAQRCAKKVCDTTRTSMIEAMNTHREFFEMGGWGRTRFLRYLHDDVSENEKIHLLTQYKLLLTKHRYNTLKRSRRFVTHITECCRCVIKQRQKLHNSDAALTSFRSVNCGHGRSAKVDRILRRNATFVFNATICT